MKDQPRFLVHKGVQSIYVQEKFDHEDEIIKTKLSAGDYSVMFISPGDKSWVDIFCSKTIMIA